MIRKWKFVILVPRLHELALSDFGGQLLANTPA